MQITLLLHTYGTVLFFKKLSCLLCCFEEGAHNSGSNCATFATEKALCVEVVLVLVLVLVVVAVLDTEESLASDSNGSILTRFGLRLATLPGR